MKYSIFLIAVFVSVSVPAVSSAQDIVPIPPPPPKRSVPSVSPADSSEGAAPILSSDPAAPVQPPTPFDPYGTVPSLQPPPDGPSTVPLAPGVAIPARPHSGPPPALAAPAAETAPIWEEDFETASRRALLEGRPILLRFGANWCAACKTLHAQFDEPAIAQEAAQWICVDIAVDRGTALVQRHAVTSIPVLVALSPTGGTIARREGAGQAEDLLAWLRENREQAARQNTAAGLAETGPPSPLLVMQTVALFDHREETIRQAALRRLRPYPHLAAEPVVKSFGEGRLAARLSALELLEQWKAPVEGLDPWQPETITEPDLKRLADWAAALERGPAEIPPPSESELALAAAEIDRMLQADPAEADAVRQRLARFGKYLMPAVLQRLEKAETEEQRESLRTLRYRLTASDALVLRWPGGLARLATSNVAVRRQATGELVEMATAGDRDLLAELFSDADPLVRELSLRGMQRLGGTEAVVAMARLLKDPEPNVRAAVLKLLEEQPQPALAPVVAKYAATETDPDLLGHAIRVLATSRSADPEVLQALLVLLENEHWQVRAEAVKALGDASERLGGSWDSGITGFTINSFEGPFDSSPPDTTAVELRLKITQAMLKLLGDPEPFVVSRAAIALQGVDIPAAVEPMLAAAEKYPELAPDLIEQLTDNEKMWEKARPKLVEYLDHENPALRGPVLENFFKNAEFDSPEAEQYCLRGLNDPDEKIAAATAELLWTRFDAEMDKYQAEVQEQYHRRSYSSTADYYAVQREIKDKLRPWARQYAAGEHRPAWTEKTVEPLGRLLGSSNYKYRMSAIAALTTLGCHQEAYTALDTLLDEIAVDENSSRLYRTDATLPLLFEFLTPEQRQASFLKIQRLTIQEKIYFSGLSEKIVQLDGKENARSIFMGLLSEDFANAELAGSVLYGLTYPVYGIERDWSDPSPEAREMIQADAESFMAGKAEMQRLVGILLLGIVDRPKAIETAHRWLQQPDLPEKLRIDLQQFIVLATEDPSAKNQLAAQWVVSSSPELKKLAMRYLTGDEDVLTLFRGRFRVWYDRGESNPFESSYSRRDGWEPIIPTAPPGITLADVTPLLGDPEPATAAMAAYLAVLLGDNNSIDRLLDLWRTHYEEWSGDDRMVRFVYRAIAVANRPGDVAVLRAMYEAELLDDYGEPSEFYWTIRIMSGPEILQFRKELRSKGVAF